MEELPLLGSPSINNLSVHKWHHRLPGTGETADLIRRAQAGDQRAKADLLSNYHRKIRKIVSNFIPPRKLRLDGPSHADLMAAAMVGFLEAIGRFNLRRNNGFDAYARWYVENEVREEAKRWKKNGAAGETRAERIAYSYPHAKAGELAFILDKRGVIPDCTVKQAEEVVESITARRCQRSYDAIGGFEDDLSGADHSNGFARSIRDPRREEEWTATPYDPKIRTGKPTRQQIKWVYECFSPAQLSPQVVVFGRHSRNINALAGDADKLAERLLRAMGRRGYALWLVRRQKPKPISHLQLQHIGLGLGFDASGYPEPFKQHY